MRIGTGGGTVSVGARWNTGSGAPSQGYNAEMDSAGLVSLLRVSDWAVLGTYQIPDYAANTWVTLRLRASGSSLSVDVNGVTQISASDATFSSGQAGVWSYQPGSARAHSVDDFTIVQLGASLGGAKALAKPIAAPRAQTAPQPPPVVTKYYPFNGQRVAIRKNNVVTWLHSDMLGSASLATDVNGNLVPGSDTRYKPYGELRAGGAGVPTDRLFTGYVREKASYVGSLDFAQARFYSPLLGRFVSADSIVPGTSNPQALNRFSYVFDRPTSLVDLSGHGPCAGKSNNDFWECRWYTAHGYELLSGNWSQCLACASFEDEDILRDTLGEAGIQLTNSLFKSWALDEMTAVAQGVIDLANKVGSFGQLYSLLGGGATIFHRGMFPWFLGGNVPANTYPVVDTSVVSFWNNLFQRDSSGSLLNLPWIRGTTVHELAHIIDYNYKSLPGGVRASAVAPSLDVSDYARENRFGLEKFAENVTVWVYGAAYPRQNPQALATDMSDWLNRALTGMGW